MLTQDAIRLGIHPNCKKKKELELPMDGLSISKGQIIDTADGGNGIIAKIDFEDLKYQELKKLAKKRRLKFDRFIKKIDLIELLKSND